MGKYILPGQSLKSTYARLARVCSFFFPIGSMMTRAMKNGIPSILGEPLINPNPVTVSLEELGKGDFKVRIGKPAALIESDEVLQLHLITSTISTTSTFRWLKDTAEMPHARASTCLVVKFHDIM